MCFANNLTYNVSRKNVPLCSHKCLYTFNARVVRLQSECTRALARVIRASAQVRVISVSTRREYSQRVLAPVWNGPKCLAGLVGPVHVLSCFYETALWTNKNDDESSCRIDTLVFTGTKLINIAQRNATVLLQGLKQYKVVRVLWLTVYILRIRAIDMHMSVDVWCTRI